LWVALFGVFACVDLPQAYKAAYTANTFVVSPTYAEASMFVKTDMAGVAAPPCKDGRATCEPWNREWKDSGLTLLPGATVNDSGNIEGPYLIYDHFGFANMEAAFYDKTKFLAWVGLGPPALLGLLMLAGGWVAAGFRSK
jgi:hypothetical protein